MNPCSPTLSLGPSASYPVKLRLSGTPVRSGQARVGHPHPIEFVNQSTNNKYINDASQK
jgi:hypothetical protein